MNCPFLESQNKRFFINQPTVMPEGWCFISDCDYETFESGSLYTRGREDVIAMCTSSNQIGSMDELDSRVNELTDMLLIANEKECLKTAKKSIGETLPSLSNISYSSGRKYLRATEKQLSSEVVYYTIRKAKRKVIIIAFCSSHEASRRLCKILAKESTPA